MTMTKSGPATRVLRFVAALLMFSVFVSPAVALAQDTWTMSGTVSGPTPTLPHPVEVTIWDTELEEWAESFATDGAWSWEFADPSKSYRVSFGDDPYAWYRPVAFPGVPNDGLYPTGGSNVTSASPVVDITLAAVGASFAGTVKDKTTMVPAEGIVVTSYSQDGGAWITDRTTQTDVNGYYELHGLTQGEQYLVEFGDGSGGYSPVYYQGAGSQSAATPITAPAPGSPVVLGETLITHVVSVERVFPRPVNVWSQAVNAVKRQFASDVTRPIDATNQPNYADVTHVVIASSDTAYQANLLPVPGLCWAYQVDDAASYNAYYNAPLVLVSAAAKTDPAVLALISSIGKGNGGKRLTLHVVGNTNAVPDARITEIKAYLQANGVTAPLTDRIGATGDRYTLARDIAYRMKSAVIASKSKGGALVLPGFVLVANGADPAKYFESMALSPVAAYNGAPILLVSATTVPAATYSAISAFRPSKLYATGGATAISSATLGKLKTTWSGYAIRIWGPDAYQNSLAITKKAISMGWLYADSSVSVATSVPNAAIGGLLAATEGGPLLISSPSVMNKYNTAWLGANKNTLGNVYVVGSTTSPNDVVYNAIKSAVGN